MNEINRTVSLAPMMGVTDRHFRVLARQLSSHVLLYTEMLTTGALLRGDRQKLLAYSPEEHPLALQVGGSNPNELMLCARIAQDFSFNEINLNVGCPSDRVQAGQFGACLFKQPELVAECVATMIQAVNIPVTVKTRTGVDELNSYEDLHHFISLVSQAGCSVFIIHARQAWLKGLNPRENRHIPPLQYPVVYQLKKDFPHLKIIINGGIQSLAEINNHLAHVDGVMIGRKASANPYWLAEIETALFDKNLAIPSQQTVILDYLPYVIQQLEHQVSLRHLTKHLINFFQGLSGAKRWRRYLSEHCIDNIRGVQVIKEALEMVVS